MNTKGVNFQPSERGQFSTAVDTRDVIWLLSHIRVPKLEGVWGWCPGCPGRWGVAEIRVLFFWLEMTGCPAALDAPAAD
jgi:hypothetical protein